MQASQISMKVLLSQLAEVLFREPLKSKIMAISLGKPGEVADHLTQWAKDEITLLILDQWKSQERFPPGSETEIISNHKVRTWGSLPRHQTGTEVIITPDGSVAVLVTHLSGFGSTIDFAKVNHALVTWNLYQKMWEVAKFHGTMKMYVLGDLQHDQISVDAAIKALGTIAPYETLKFGRLDNALAEARRFALLGYAVVEDIVPTKSQIRSFMGIPDIETLAPPEDLMLNAAIEMMENIPSILDLQQMIKARVALN
jgi:hypothetical protein